MLLKALLTRLSIGATSSFRRENKVPTRFSKLTFDKYPQMADLVVQLLVSSLDRNIESLAFDFDYSREVKMAYPAIEILERIGIPSSHRCVVKYFLMQHLSSPVWHLRDKAANSLSHLISDQDILGEIQGLFSLEIHSQNSLHGRLLYTRYMVSGAERLGEIWCAASTLEELIYY
jgi:hypothetical protein